MGKKKKPSMKTDVRKTGAHCVGEKLIVAQYGWIGNGEWYNIKLEKQGGLDLAELCRSY